MKNGLKYAKIDVKSLSTEMYILSTEMYNNFYTSELTNRQKMTYTSQLILYV